jgi:hypothetical protein
MEKSSLMATIDRYKDLLSSGPSDDAVRRTLREMLAEAEAAMAALVAPEGDTEVA